MRHERYVLWREFWRIVVEFLARQRITTVSQTKSVVPNNQFALRPPFYVWSAGMLPVELLLLPSDFAGDAVSIS